MAQKHTAANFYWATTSGIVAIGIFINLAARVKSGGKSVRSLVVTRRRPNPTWSKAK